MRDSGIHNGGDLKKFTEAELVRLFGKAGRMYYLFARGVDDRQVAPERVRKSLGAEITFLSDSCDEGELIKRLWEIAQETWGRVSKSCFFGRTVTLKIKYSDFRDVTRRQTLPKTVKKLEVFWKIAIELFSSIKFDEENKIRLMGLTVSNTEENGSGFRQLLLDFGDDEEYQPIGGISGARFSKYEFLPRQDNWPADNPASRKEEVIQP
jgi:DNA polymerase-4